LCSCAVLREAHDATRSRAHSRKYASCTSSNISQGATQATRPNESDSRLRHVAAAASAAAAAAIDPAAVAAALPLATHSFVWMHCLGARRMLNGCPCGYVAIQQCLGGHVPTARKRSVRSPRRSHLMSPAVACRGKRSRHRLDQQGTPTYHHLQGKHQGVMRRIVPELGVRHGTQLPQSRQGSCSSHRSTHHAWDSTSSRAGPSASPQSPMQLRAVAPKAPQPAPASDRHDLVSPGSRTRIATATWEHEK
jgi:hypothetical protein